MKRWALLTVALYVVYMSIFAVPMLWFLGYNDDFGVPRLQDHNSLGLFYVYCAPVLILAQAVLLLVPLAAVRERPVKRRKIIVSAVIGAFPMAAMAVGFFGSILLMIFGEEGPGFFTLYTLPAFWLVWGIIFWRSFASSDPTSFTSTMTRWLLRGSILELVVAVPSHIISRRRDDCCAPTFTLLGIVTGLSIALMSFGPGLFFLFARRIKDKRGRTAT